jgi:LmbE family N-acetylglucosaminyl deacetylase
VRHAFRTSLALFVGAVGPVAGQLAPPGTGGIAALAGALNQLGAYKRVLVIGAHPDDEDTELLTLLSRGMGAQAAYLSLTRGEGGQNLIGPELGPELGIIRTEELLAARQLDGARQFFTRAYDFGYSKSAEETFRFWPRDSLLADVLAVIRRFRPQIMVSIFSGTSRDGHGQHQAAGMLARQAFDLLRDSSWGPAKLYRSARFDTGATTLTLQGGVLDPVSGRSYHQIAMAGRSRHRSQDMGQLERAGPSVIRLGFVGARNVRQAERGVAGGGGGAVGAGATPPDAGAGGSGSALFSGVDTVLRGRERFVALIDSVRARLNPSWPSAIVPWLARAAGELRGDGGGAGSETDAEQREILEAALVAAAAVSVDAVADDAIVVPGGRLQVETGVWNAGDSAITLDGLDLIVPAGWKVASLDFAPPEPPVVAPGTVITRRFVLTVAPGAPRSQPYFLRRPLGGALYDWTGAPAAWRGLPFEPPLVEVTYRLTVAGAPVTLRREVVYRYRDQAIGEIRRPIFVTQPFDVAVTPELVVWPIDGSAGAARQFTIVVTNRNRGTASARVSLAPPAGWKAPPPATLSFQGEDEEKRLTVTIAPPAPPAPQAGVAPGVFEVRATAAMDGKTSEGALRVIDYAHIRPRALARPSTAEIRAARISLPKLSLVGYVRGASDRVPEALQAVGVPIELLAADSLAAGDLSRYDAIVIGSRAYEVDPALVATNGRVLDYARAGGRVIVQYQQYLFVEGNFAPYPLRIGRPHDRVSDETAPVTILDRTSPVFHVPNEIGADDWQGWVQERGLYFAREWDAAYTALVETHDPGGQLLQGGLLVAPLGKGTYVYTGLSFFRQLPAGVPGAYRLFANLLALGQK